MEAQLRSIKGTIEVLPDDGGQWKEETNGTELIKRVKKYKLGWMGKKGEGKTRERDCLESHGQTWQINGEKTRAANL